MIKRLCIIGVGLIGGSVARALKQAEAVEEVVGFGRNEANLQRALELGVIDRGESVMAAALAGADVVMMASPVGAMATIFQQMAPHLKPGTIITDAGSTKGSVVEAARQAFGYIPSTFVPGHPIAGTEKSGVEAAFAELYQERRVILTPLAETDPQALETVRWLWQQCGAEVVEMDVEHHDAVLAETSHLPHMLAYALVDSLARLDDSDEIFGFAAGGFRDFTRIASSNPQMWHDICLANREALLAILRRFSDDLARLTQALDEGDGEFLLETFTRAKQARDRFCE